MGIWAVLHDTRGTDVWPAVDEKGRRLENLGSGRSLPSCDDQASFLSLGVGHSYTRMRGAGGSKNRGRNPLGSRCRRKIGPPQAARSQPQYKNNTVGNRTETSEILKQ